MENDTNGDGKISFSEFLMVDKDRLEKLAESKRSIQEPDPKPKQAGGEMKVVNKAEALEKEKAEQAEKKK